MKTLVIAALLALTHCVARGQGEINFSNRLYYQGTPVIDAPVTYCGQGLTGPGYLGQLYVFKGSSSSFEPVGTPMPFWPNPAFGGTIRGGAVTVPFLLGGQQADVILRAWAAVSGATYEEASGNPNGIFGQSAPTNITLGGGGTLPAPPADLYGLQPFDIGICVPEPSTLLLGVLGLALIVLSRLSNKSLEQPARTAATDSQRRRSTPPHLGRTGEA